MLDGLGNATPISVAAFPVAWRVEVVKEKRYHGWDYVRYTPNIIGSVYGCPLTVPGFSGVQPI